MTGVNEMNAVMREQARIREAVCTLEHFIRLDDTVYTHEFGRAAELTEEELDFIDDMTAKAFEDERCERNYVLVALCGSILSNIVRQTDGGISAEEIMKWVEIATTSQLGHDGCEACDKAGERIPQEEWDLGRFTNNPQTLHNHGDARKT